MSAFAYCARRPSPMPSAKPATPLGPMPGWGWLEWFMVAQTALPALMFIPGLSVIRTPARVAAFSIALVAWIAILSQRKVTRPGRPFPATPWLAAAVGWFGLMVFQ